MRKASPPIWLAYGSVTHSTAEVAMAASAKLPPRIRMSNPAETASGCEAATMPFCATTTPRCWDTLIMDSRLDRLLRFAVYSPILTHEETLFRPLAVPSAGTPTAFDSMGRNKEYPSHVC